MKHFLSLAAIGLACACLTTTGAAEQAVTHPLEGEAPAPDFRLPGPHIEVQVRMPDRVAKPNLLPEDVAKTPPPPDDPLVALRHEMENLRDEMRMLQATLDLIVNRIMADLREENETLRKEVRRLHAIHENADLPDLSLLPRPGFQLIEEVLSETDVPPDVPPQEEFLPPDTPPQPETPVISFHFSVLHEWGRSPELARELGDDIPALKGMVGLVPAGSRRADIEQLGRELRGRYDEYNNINIEIFDDLLAAEQFLETQEINPAHRVLSVSRHEASRRDVILYLDHGQAFEVAR